MKTSMAVAGALAALLALTAQAPPAAAPPVAVNYCALNTWTFAPVGAGGMLIVRFTVPGSVAVDDVRFRMLWGDQTFTMVDDAGSFAPGLEIRHQLDFQHYGEITGSMMSSLYLAIDHVHFANGTSWDAPLGDVSSAKCVIYLGLGGH